MKSIADKPDQSPGVAAQMKLQGTGREMKVRGRHASRLRFRKPHSPKFIIRREQAWAVIKRLPLQWYVYAMWRFDRSSPVPFYVGKGRGYRAMHHELPSKGGRNPHKQRIIDLHRKKGWWVGYSLSFYASEKAAFRAECRLIAQFGRSGLGTGILANLTDGGEGTAGHIGLRGDTNPRARAIFADGESFSYVGAAARRLGVDTTVILHRIKNGWLGYYYQDEGQRPQKAGITQRYRKEISVLGSIYPSLSEAAQATGMGFRMIAARVARGWEGYFYLADGPHPRREKGRRSDNVAVMVRGERFFSIAMAAAATGESVAKIAKRCGSSNFPDYLFEDPARPKDQKSKPPVEPIGVIVMGRLYDSLSEAAAAPPDRRGRSISVRKRRLPGLALCRCEQECRPSLRAAIFFKPEGGVDRWGGI